MQNSEPKKDQSFNQLQDLLQSIDQVQSHTGDSVFDELDKIGESESSGELKLNHSFTLQLQSQSTIAVLYYHPNPNQPPTFYSPQQLMDLLHHQGVKWGILENNLRKTCELIREDPQRPLEVTIAVGQEPQPARALSLLFWIGDLSHLEDRNHIFVGKDELLMRIDPGSEGHPGKNVFGKEVPPQAVTSEMVSPGENVYVNEASEFYAQCPGLVFFDQGTVYVQKVNRDATFDIHIEDHAMKVYLSATPPMGDGRPLTFPDLRSAFSSRGICAGFDRDILKKILYIVNEQKRSVQRKLVARGKKPRQGKDGQIQWHVKPDLPRERYVIQSDGSIDFHHLKKFVTVKEGTHLLTVQPPTQGENGYTVLGEKLPGRWGKKVEIRPGDNIIRKQKDTEWFAGCAGKYSFEGEVLNVVPVLEISSDVDFSTGNVNFSGDVIVHGSVNDGFEVKAKGNITIAGSIDASRVIAGNRIEVRQGIFGKGQGKVIARTDVISKFLQNAHVEAGRDVIVGSQILNSQVYANRMIKVQSGKGTIIGGEVIAGHRISAKFFGGEYGTKTLVEVGLDFSVFEQMRRLDQDRNNLLEWLQRLDQFFKQHKDEDSLDSQKQSLLQAARQKQQSLQQSIAQIKKDYSILSRRLYIPHSPEIECFGKIMPDVLLKIRERRLKIKVPTPRCRVRYDEEKDQLVFVKL